MEPAKPEIDEHSSSIRFGAFELYLATGELHRGGVIVPLRPLATRALVTLVHHAGRLTSREELRRALWAGEELEWNQALNQCIRQVRVALGDDAAHPRFVETVHGRGYRFVASVAPGDGAVPELPPGSRRRSFRAFAAGFGAACATLATLLLLCSFLAS